MGQKSSFALLIGPDAGAIAAIRTKLTQYGISCGVAADGQDSWEMLATRAPDIIFVELAATGLDVFFRRLRDEYMGARPRLIAVADSSDLTSETNRFDFDAVLLKPLHPVMLDSLLSPEQRPRPISLDRGRLREMLRMSCIGNDLQAELNAVAQRLVLVYGVSTSVVLATASERQWVGTVAEPIPAEKWPHLWDRCDEAVSAGAPLLCPAEAAAPDEAGTATETRFAAPIKAPNGTVVGALCLVAEGTRLFTAEARDALHDLAQRFGQELSWRSVHDRVAGERDRLRENAMLDPMLGILSRAALEQAIATEVARSQRTRESLCIAVMDISGLRHVNDRYGHVAGDLALKHVAAITRRIIRAQDIVARYGGDEFAVVLPSTVMPGATALLERLRQAVETEPLVTGEQEISLRVAIGVTEHTGDEDDTGSMLARAMNSAVAAREHGGTIAVADQVTPSEVTRPGIKLDRFEAGITLGGMYQIVHEISRGAMGVVYRAEDLGLSRPVAIKMLRPDLVNDQELVERFRAEAGVLAALNNENLVRVYSFVEDRDDVFFVMELVEGVSLDDVITESLEIDEYIAAPRVVSIANQVASALDTMHQAGLMHRDVKPGNVVLDRAKNRAVLVDVGLAKRMGTRGKPAGTPGFIAPETLRGGTESPACDVYGLAATAYSLLTARAPFGRADSYKEILQRQLEERPPSPSSYRADLNDDVDRILLDALHVDPTKRPGSAGEFAANLELALSTVGDPEHAQTTRLPHFDPPLSLDSSVEVGSGGVAPLSSGSVTQVRTDSLTQVKSGRTLTLNLELIPPGRGDSQTIEPMTRGVVFRGAAQLLGLRTSNSWVRSVAKTNSALADALSLRTSQLAWLSSQRFLELLEALAADGRDPAAFGRQLGELVVDQTFQRFYPSSPESLSPKSTLSAIDILWRKYHTWGEFEITRLSSRSAELKFTGQLRTGVSAFIEGWIEEVVRLSDGKRPRAKTNHETKNEVELQVYWGA